MEKKQGEFVDDKDDIENGVDNDDDANDFDKNLDDLEKRKVDSKRIKKIDQTKSDGTETTVSYGQNNIYFQHANTNLCISSICILRI